MKSKLIGISFLVGILLCSVSGASAAMHFAQLPSFGAADPNPDALNAYAFSSETQVPSQSADDFTLKTDTPIKSVTWWGSYYDPVVQSTNFFPSPWSDNWGDPAVNPAMAGFNINIYTDVPAGTGIPPWSHPATQVASFTIDFADANENLDYTIARAGGSQKVYQYEADLSGLVLNPGAVYWISIQAVNDGAEPLQWGWQESWQHWNDNAVQKGFPPAGTPQPGWWHLNPGEDLAFEINLVPVPTTLLLLGSGLIGLIGFRRRFR